MPAAHLQHLGDTALLAIPNHPLEAAQQVMRWVTSCEARPLQGVTDVVAAFGSLAIYYDPLQVSVSKSESPSVVVLQWVTQCIAQAEKIPVPVPREHNIAVCYGGKHGPDLKRVAEQTGMTEREVVELHASTSYLVEAVGFTPGFPYLQGLPQRLHTPRQATPRTNVPAGSVAIGGPYTGVYPHSSPGGWNLIGKTPTLLFSPFMKPPALFKTGDRVRFFENNNEEFDKREQQQADSHPAATHNSPRPTTPVFEVLTPGTQTTLQDLGRAGHRKLGVSASGAMDEHSMRLANLLVGNQGNCVALEITLLGPELRCLAEIEVGIAGAVPKSQRGSRRLFFRAGERIDLRSLGQGARVYLAIAGGFQSDALLGGSGTDLLTGFGGHQGRALQAGDTLYQSPAALSRQPFSATTPNWSVPVDHLNCRQPGQLIPLRVLPGLQHEQFRTTSWQAFTAGRYRVTAASNRMGLRLEGPKLGATTSATMTSQPVIQGAIQVPPDGMPILLGADSQTLGGYPMIACVASVDLPAVGQLRPGDTLEFIEIDLSQAEHLRREAETAMRQLAAGIAIHNTQAMT